MMGHQKQCQDAVGQVPASDVFYPDMSPSLVSSLSTSAALRFVTPSRTGFRLGAWFDCTIVGQIRVVDCFSAEGT